MVSLIDICSGLFEFLDGSGVLSSAEQNLSLELSVFGIELDNSGIIGGLRSSLISSLLIKGGNELVSQFVEGLVDLLDGILVGEVLFGG